MSTVDTSTAGPGADLSGQCLNCAAAAVKHAQDAKRIADLEAQVQYLTTKASAAADKLADYEDELANLATLPSTDFPRITISNPTSRRSSRDVERSPQFPNVTTLAPTPEKRPSVSNRFHSFLSRRGSPAQVPPPLHLVPNAQTVSGGGQLSPSDFNFQLSTERHLRNEAETALASLQAELEELSASLFSQANEMVADERRLRAKEEDRASMWEEQAKALQERWKGAEEQASTWEDRAKSAETKIKDLQGKLEAGGQKDMRSKRLEALEKAVVKLGHVHAFLNKERTEHHNAYQEL